MIKDGINSETSSIDSFLMIGQSNMAGRGEIDEVEPIDNELCYMLRMGRWQRMSEPVNPDRAIWGFTFHSGVSLAASFADEYARAFRHGTGLIPCADGGTGLVQWMPGEVLYDHALMQTRLAMRSSTLRAILWHQGETDCSRHEDISAYKDRFINMMTSLREEIGLGDIPVIIGELSEDIDREWNLRGRTAELNRIFHEIEAVLPNCIVVPSEGLSLKPDGIHFDSVSCRIFGKRYFEKYLEITKTYIQNSGGLKI